MEREPETKLDGHSLLPRIPNTKKQPAIRGGLYPCSPPPPVTVLATIIHQVYIHHQMLLDECQRCLEVQQASTSLQASLLLLLLS